jgi:hypothetical protein
LADLFTGDLGADTHISEDGRLALLVRTSSGFTYGLIFHGRTRRCTTAGCAAVIDDTGVARPADSLAPMLDHDHTPSYPIGAPQPGEWFFHS